MIHLLELEGSAPSYPVDVLDVGKAFGLPSVPVHDDPHICNLACTGEELKELLLSRLQGQVVSKDGSGVAVQLQKLPLPLPLLLHFWRCGLSPANRMLPVNAPASSFCCLQVSRADKLGLTI